MWSIYWWKSQSFHFREKSWTDAGLYSISTCFYKVFFRSEVKMEESLCGMGRVDETVDKKVVTKKQNRGQLWRWDTWWERLSRLSIPLLKLRNVLKFSEPLSKKNGIDCQLSLSNVIRPTLVVNQTPFVICAKKLLIFRRNAAENIHYGK